MVSGLLQGIRALSPCAVLHRILRRLVEQETRLDQRQLGQHFREHHSLVQPDVRCLSNLELWLCNMARTIILHG